MKKVITILTIIHFSLITANAQWILQHEYIPFTSFHHIAFINRWTGWVCGDGLIKKTTNGGVNWIEQSHEAINKNLRYILPVDSQVIYCSGWFETILKTTNGGINWQTIRNGPNGEGNSYFAISFINKDIGWFVGTGWKILKTYNGGVSFDSISTYSIFATFIWDMKFKDENTGLMVGDGGQVFKSSNGGYNWYTANIPLNDTLPNFYKMAVYQNQFCFLAGNDCRIFSSTDFGSNWTRLGKIIIPNQEELYCCYFSNLNIGWAGGTSGVLYKTTDGGFNWRQENTINYPGYNSSIYFYDSLIGWVTGGGCKILHTTTGGEPYVYISNNNEHILKDFILYQNYPNPFNSISKIKYALKNSICNVQYSEVQLIIYNILGKKVTTLVNQKQTTGVYEVSFDGNNFSTGMYFYCLYVNGNRIDTKKFVLLK